MYLKELKLWNFRKYGSQSSSLDLSSPNLSVPFKHGLNVLIGENDSGKTSIIDAIKIVLKTHSGEWIGLDENDFHADTTKLRIELLFEELTENEASNFLEWLSWRGTSPRVPYLVVFIEAERNQERVIPFDVRAGIDPEGAPINARSREFLRTTYLRPLRDAKAELIPRRNSRLSQILRAHPSFRGDVSEHHLLTQFRRFNRIVAKYFEGRNEDNSDLPDLRGRDLKNKIDEYLGSFSGKKSLFEISEGDMRQILERLELTFLEEQNLGLGSHNLLFMAAELLHLNKPDWNGLRLGLIEEIEAHLHPQVQLQVIKSLSELESIQLIITTHSPNIASKIDLERLIMCNGQQVLPLGSEYTHLRVTDYTFLRRFLDVTKANLFFAKGVILVEGWSEELLLTSLARLIGVDLTAKGVSIINVGNVSFLRYSAIFKRRDSRQVAIPVAVITDLDVRPDEENVLNNGVSNAVHARQTKDGKYSGGIVRTFISPHWTLEYCLGMSLCMREHLYSAIVQAGEEMRDDGYPGKTVDENWDDFSRNKSDQEIAFTMYTTLIKNGKKISKPIISQRLAGILDGLRADQFQGLLEDPSILYLINAIQYAASIDRG